MMSEMSFGYTRCGKVCASPPEDDFTAPGPAADLETRDVSKASTSWPVPVLKGPTAEGARGGGAGSLLWVPRRMVPELLLGPCPGLHLGLDPQSGPQLSANLLAD